MKYENIVVIVTVIALTAWFFIGTLGGTQKGVSPRYSLDSFKGTGLIVTGTEKDAYIKKIKEAMKRQGLSGRNR